MSGIATEYRSRFLPSAGVKLRPLLLCCAVYVGRSHLQGSRMPWVGEREKKRKKILSSWIFKTTDHQTLLTVSLKFLWCTPNSTAYLHTLTAEPDAQDLDAVSVLIPTISLLRLTYLYLLPYFPKAILQDFTTKLVSDIVGSPILISFLALCGLLHFTIIMILSDPHAEVSFASTARCVLGLRTIRSGWIAR